MAKKLYGQVIHGKKTRNYKRRDDDDGVPDLPGMNDGGGRMFGGDNAESAMSVREMLKLILIELREIRKEIDLR